MKSISPVIEKTEAFIIAEIFQNNKNSVVYIGKDEREIINIKKKLSWVFTEQKILLYRAWDQIPYDNVSPSKDIQTSRLETLFYLASKKNEKILCKYLGNDHHLENWNGYHLASYDEYQKG